MKTTKNLSDVIFKSVIAFAFMFLVFMVMYTRADAGALDYLSNHYTGTVTRDEGADMYTEPGTWNPKVTTADGTAIHLDYGTEVRVMGEFFDKENDMWYQCQVTIGDTVYEGYVYNSRVTRGDVLAFTPTPIPTATPTPEVATGGVSTPDVKEMKTKIQ